MKLYLCEKPSQARDIGAVLGATIKRDGHLEGEGMAVTWGYGHLLEMEPPDAYDQRYKRWSLDDLPIIPDVWRLSVKRKTSKQFTVVKRLLKAATEVVIATDADREGETIAREILDLVRYRGPVKRLWLSALDESSIRKALAQIKPGSETEPLYYAGIGRARADWLVGMNLTRAYTIIGRASGADSVLSIGRVQSPTLRLVVERDREIEAFTPQPYYAVSVECRHEKGVFTAKWVPPEAVSDEEGRCTNLQAARQLAQQCENIRGLIVHVQTERKKQPPPLALNLSTLQQEASRRFGMGAQTVLDCAQSLYETHKATTYPRSDCRYLPESQHDEAPGVIAALRQSDRELAGLCQRADPALRSRVWNDAKISAHHAIIPTAGHVDINAMRPDERRIYDLVRRYYLAQFMPHYEYDRGRIDVLAMQQIFRASSNTLVNDGWRQALETQKDNNMPGLPLVHKQDSIIVGKADVVEKQTTPPEHYTEGTLIAAMENIGRHVTDERLKRVLKETAGIGTEATRAGIIQTLLERGFIKKHGKKALISASMGRALVDMAPEPVTNPAMTALMEQELTEIAEGRMTLGQFMVKQETWLTRLIQHAKTQHINLPESAVAERKACPACGQPMIRRKSAHGSFWGCSGYPECKTVERIEGGTGKKTGKSKKTGRQPGTRTRGSNRHSGQAGDECSTCGKGQLVQRQTKGGKRPGSLFLGCTRFPECKHFEWINND